ncbi:MAG: type I restriction endonuclease subunit R [Candidatus Tyloplasma litorale]|nr:MAG: type I restriction endonuclease subunit R [Mycoplasmatales bacterium]
MNKTDLEQQIERRFIQTLVKDLGWERTEIRDEHSLNLNILKQLTKINKNLNPELQLSDIQELRRKIDATKFNVVKFNSWLKNGVEIRKNTKPQTLKLMNEDFCNNYFQVTNQFVVNSLSNRDRRYDLTLLINGLPLVQIELKNPRINIKKAINQINFDYKDGYSGFFKLIQLFIVSNDVDTRYFSNTGRRNEFKFDFAFNWSNYDKVVLRDSKSFSKDFLRKCQISKFLKDYIVPCQSQKYEEESLIALRPYQVHAIEKIVENCESNTGKGGYVWHTTGSGKTITSYQASKLLSRVGKFEKVLFIVDRTDLDAQTIEEFKKFDNNDEQVARAESVRDLINKLNSSKEKILITSIQKLNLLISDSKNESKVNSEIFNKKYVMIFDEAHRSQAGEMSLRIKNKFSNSIKFGFTGTPIFKENAEKANKSSIPITTELLFGNLIHSYKMEEAIEDKAVLGFKYIEYNTLSDESKNKLREYKNSDKKIDADEIENSLFYDANRMNQIVDAILKNHNDYTQNKYCSIFATYQIKNILKYFDIFKNEKNHGFKIAALFSYNQDQDLNKIEEVLQHFNSLYPADHYNFTIKDAKDVQEVMRAYKKAVSDKLKSGEIDIVIVHNMLLTGFDSKLINTLYVDKPLKYHGLIQAFSRTNRVYDKDKKFGKIVSFRELKDNIDKAILLFNDGNPDAIGYRQINEFFDDLLNLFEELIGEKRIPTKEEIEAFVDKNIDEEMLKNTEIMLKILKNYENLKYFPEFSKTENLEYVQANQVKEYVSLAFNNTREKLIENNIINLNIRNHENEKEDEVVKLIIDFNVHEKSITTINNEYITELIIEFKNANLSEEELEKKLKEIESKLINLSERKKFIYLKDYIRRKFSEESFDDDPQKIENELEEEIASKQEKEFIDFYNRNGILDIEYIDELEFYVQKITNYDKKFDDIKPDVKNFCKDKLNMDLRMRGNFFKEFCELIEKVYY